MILLDNKTDPGWSWQGDTYIYNFPRRQKTQLTNTPTQSFKWPFQFKTNMCFYLCIGKIINLISIFKLLVTLLRYEILPFYTRVNIILRNRIILKIFEGKNQGENLVKILGGGGSGRKVYGEVKKFMGKSKSLGCFLYHSTTNNIELLHVMCMGNNILMN